MGDRPTLVRISYNVDCTCTLTILAEEIEATIWIRLLLAIHSKKLECYISENQIRMNWSDVLGILRDIGSKESQNRYAFRFVPEGQAKRRIREFADQVKSVQDQRRSSERIISVEEIEHRLNKLGFTKRKLRNFQYRDLSRLLSMSHGANFSVPGAGKTTVTFALHLLSARKGQHFIVVAPMSALQSWIDIVEMCIHESAPDEVKERFTWLTEGRDKIAESLNTGAKRFLISYDEAINHERILERHISNNPTHLVLDEAHCMKASWHSHQRMSLLRIANEPVRRDILSSTPMLSEPSDIISQVDFLWPGHNFGQDIKQGKSPQEVLGNLYVRTTKKELELAKIIPNFIDVEMDPAQQEMYSIVRKEFLRNWRNQGQAKIQNVRKSVLRLLQISVNPLLALSSMVYEDKKLDSLLVEEILEEGHSSKLKAVMKHVYSLTNEGKKVVIWTIFSDTINCLNSSLADLNPVFIGGGDQLGSVSNPESREERIDRFRKDQNCCVLIADTAVCGGINLHEVCHDAIYADRDYSATHYLQTIDRIHTLDSPRDIETDIYIFRSIAPAGIGSIDRSVSRRLIEKTSGIKKILDDPDIQPMTLEEEEEFVSFGIDSEDMSDLVSEFEGKATELMKEEI